MITFYCLIFKTFIFSLIIWERIAIQCKDIFVFFKKLSYIKIKQTNTLCHFRNRMFLVTKNSTFWLMSLVPSKQKKEKEKCVNGSFLKTREKNSMPNLNPEYTYLFMRKGKKKQREFFFLERLLTQDVTRNKSRLDIFMYFLHSLLLLYKKLKTFNNKNNIMYSKSFMSHYFITLTFLQILHWISQLEWKYLTRSLIYFVFNSTMCLLLLRNTISEIKLLHLHW